VARPPSTIWYVALAVSCARPAALPALARFHCLFTSLLLLQAKTLDAIAGFSSKCPPGFESVLEQTANAIVSYLYHKSKKFMDRNMKVAKV